MSSQMRATVTHSLSPLERCAPEILERIVLSAVEERLPGPPSSLLPLLVTSKTINFALSPKNNNHLYAKIFTLKFDTAAASRRLTERWLTNQCRSSELRRRFEVLNRIRRGIVDGSTLSYDLWTVFLILLEHDHKNGLQLTEWAKVNAFALTVADRWFAGGYESESDQNVGSLVCTIIWELVREAELPEPLRRGLQGSLYIHLIGGHRLPLFYASEEFFVIRGQPEELEGRVRGRPPGSTQVQYYGHTITIAAPPLASTCLSVFMLALNQASLRCTPGSMREYFAGRTFSERMDTEWYRLIMCHSITSTPKGLGGRRFTPSVLVGSWKGSILIPHFVAFGAFLRSNQPRDAIQTPMEFLPVEVELREHHCLGDKPTLMAGLSEDRIGDDPVNAWIPRGSTFIEQNGTLEIYDPVEDRTAVYETYRPDAQHPYVSGYVPETHWFSGDGDGSSGDESSGDESSGDESPGDEPSGDEPSEDESSGDGPSGEMLEEPGAEVVDEEPSIPDETQGLVNNPTYVDDDDHWQDVVQHRYSGIHDIIVTGTMRSGDRAVHQLVGRVRGWDGLIILLRQPSLNDAPEVSRVFRGYVHGERHIVGRWKQTSTPFGEIGWEGGFILNKTM